MEGVLKALEWLYVCKSAIARQAGETVRTLNRDARRAIDVPEIPLARALGSPFDKNVFVAAMMMR